MDKDRYLASIPQIQSLFRTVFQREISAEYLKWRYASNARGVVTVETLERDNEVVAHYASTPVEFQHGSATLRGALVAGVMTHPSLQGQGVFQKLGAMHEEKHREQGFDFLYAFPNRHSDPIFLRKLGWIAVHDIPMMTLSLQQVAQEPKPSPDAVFDDRFDRFENAAFLDRTGLFTQRRSQQFLRWRYSDNPLNTYRNIVIADSSGVQAYGVVKIHVLNGRRYLDVVDFFAFEPVALPSLMCQVIAFARGQDCQGIHAWSPRHHASHQLLLKIGFIPQAPITHMSAKALTTDLEEKIRCFADWWITMGDSDVY